MKPKRSAGKSRRKAGGLDGKLSLAPRSEAGGESLASRDATAGKPFRLGVAAQPALFCEVLAGHLSRERSLHVVGRASTEEQIVRLLKTERPQVLLFDYEGLGPNAESVISRLHRGAPATRILVLATRSSQDTVVRVLRVGASGLVGKQLDFATLVRAIHALAIGELWANRRATADFVEFLTDDSARITASDGQLTPRETEIIDDVGRGFRNRDIARRLNISEKTVKSHLNNIFRKLRVDNRFAAGLYALARTQL
jgi:DNA-binding NarL/FixJ family response regulator